MTESFRIESIDTNREQKEKLIARWGDFATETMRDPTYSFFCIPSVEGMIGFKEELGCAVTFGDPICSKNNAPQLVQAFHDYCQQKKLNIAFLLASEDFSKWAIKNLCNVMIEVGEELVFDPQCDPLEGPRNKLRNKVNHAQHVGLSVAEYIPLDEALESKIQDVGDKWLDGRKGPQIYLAHVKFFENRENKRWFYVQDGENIIGVAQLIRIENREGWYLKFLLILPEAPRGTSEFLMTCILQKLREENCRFLTYGMVPSENLGEMVGIGAFSAWLAKGTFSMAKKVFNLEKRKGYWGQFHPRAERSYILFEKPRMGFKEVRVVMNSLKVKF